MHGIGNDYIYFNADKENITNPNQLSIRLSDRHKSIGGDGIVLISKSDKADFRMRMFNADGSEGEMCGNASRCIGKYVYDKGLTSKKEISLETLAGIKYLQLHVNSQNKVESVTVDMGEPILESKLIPTTFDEAKVIDKKIVIYKEEENITCVSMGNPHCVIFKDNVDDLELDKIGTYYENYSAFPKRINTEFVEYIDPTHVKMRVWERGSGETFACGTGACAVAVACILNLKTERQITVSLLGGDLTIYWNPNDNHVYMTGPAEIAFEGEVF